MCKCGHLPVCPIKNWSWSPWAEGNTCTRVARSLWSPWAGSPVLGSMPSTRSKSAPRTPPPPARAPARKKQKKKGVAAAATEAASSSVADAAEQERASEHAQGEEQQAEEHESQPPLQEGVPGEACEGDAADAGPAVADADEEATAGLEGASSLELHPASEPRASVEETVLEQQQLLPVAAPSMAADVNATTQPDGDASPQPALSNEEEEEEEQAQPLAQRSQVEPEVIDLDLEEAARSTKDAAYLDELSEIIQGGGDVDLIALDVADGDTDAAAKVAALRRQREAAFERKSKALKEVMLKYPTGEAMLNFLREAGAGIDDLLGADEQLADLTAEVRSRVLVVLVFYVFYGMFAMHATCSVPTYVVRACDLQRVLWRTIGVTDDSAVENVLSNENLSLRQQMLQAALDESFADLAEFSLSKKYLAHGV